MKENQLLGGVLTSTSPGDNHLPEQGLTDEVTREVPAEMEPLNLEVQELKVQLRERFSEIAAVSTMLRQQTRDAKRDGAKAAWLRDVCIELANAPGWWALLPRSSRLRLQEQRLKRRDLFDADDYMARYPDVRASGMGALRHYLLHGINESRVMKTKTYS